MDNLNTFTKLVPKGKKSGREMSKIRDKVGEAREAHSGETDTLIITPEVAGSENLS